jgi:hypothetical protein
MNPSNIRNLKKAIWWYLWLLIIEGALRKWVLPGLSTPLLLVRDPLALWLIFKASQLRILWMNNYIRIAWITTAFSFIFALLFGHQNMMVAIFGARIMFLHFPLIFIIGKIFSKEDVLKMGRMLMLLSIPMTFLVALQFSSPQSAWVNRGIGGDISGGGFSGAMGYFRPPATFSFISGTVQFYVLTACFIFYYWTSKEKCAKWLLFCSSISLFLSLPLCISRSLIFGVILTLLFTLIASLRSPNAGYGVFKLVLVSLLILIGLQTVTIFSTATEAMASRFDSASKSEGGTIEGTLGTRFLGGFLNPIIEIGQHPMISGKLGMGTNAGAKMLTGSTHFLISEGEWGRLSGERGILLGLVIIALRVILVVFLTVKSWYLVKRGEILPWLILSFAFLGVLQGQWAQPSSLGFAVFSAGLVLASARKE